jgi:diguanylate cyclase (GGDEF)-like protein
MPDLYLVDKNVISFTEGWTWRGDGYKSSFSLPYHFDVSKTESLVIKNTIPENIPHGANITFKSYVQSVITKIDGEIVYEMGTDRDTFLGKDLGKFWVFIKLEPEHKGKEIEITLFSHRDALHGYAPEILISSKDALFAHNFSNTIWFNIFALFIVISGLLTDIDRLKYINDYFGHAAGDRAIIDTFEILKKNFAGIGRVYRIGGDEYSVIVKNVKREEIDAIIENITKDIVSIEKDREYDYFISIGVEEYNPEIDENIYSASIRADHKMYDDKKRHRNSVPKKMPRNTNYYK